MKLEVTVAEIAEIFKVIQKQPEQLFEMIRLDVRETVGKYLTAMMEAELTQFMGRESYVRVAGNEKHRNGSYQRSFTLKNIGEVQVKVPRAQQNEAIVKKILGPDYRLDETAVLNINASKRPYVKTAAEKQKLLRKVTQFQIEDALLAGIDMAEAMKQQIHRYELQTIWVIERRLKKLITNFAEAFALALDPRTSYQSRENFENSFLTRQYLFTDANR